MTRVLGVLVVLLALGSAAQAHEPGYWQQLENNPSCSVWNASPTHEPSETMTWSGACVNGKAQGRGTRVWRYLEAEEWKVSIYTGELMDGKAQGRGIYEWTSGKRYDGEWKEEMPHGRGAMVWASGDRYEGDWKNGRNDGRGIKEWASGDRYEGDWKNGKRTGHGVFVWGPNSEWAGNRYEGDLKDGKFHGHGIYYFANGDKCEGDWREDRLLGTGTGWAEGRQMKCYLGGKTIAFTD
jgi:hypothetical protein